MLVFSVNAQKWYIWATIHIYVTGGGVINNFIFQVEQKFEVGHEKHR